VRSWHWSPALAGVRGEDEVSDVTLPPAEVKWRVKWRHVTTGSSKVTRYVTSFTTGWGKVTRCVTRKWQGVWRERHAVTRDEVRDVSLVLMIDDRCCLDPVVWTQTLNETLDLEQSFGHAHALGQACEQQKGKEKADKLKGEKEDKRKDNILFVRLSPCGKGGWWLSTDVILYL